MQKRSSASALIPIDLEINATCRRRIAERNRKFLQDIEAAATPEEPLSSEASSRQSHTILAKANIIAEEPRRVTLEDYSSSSVPLLVLSKQLEALTKTLSKLPTQLNSVQPSPSAVLQVAGCVICGGAHEFDCCIPQEETRHEVNYMGNQPRQNFNAGGYFRFQHGQPYNSQQGQWRNHPGKQFNKDQGGPSNRPQQQGPSLYDRTTKLEETLAQFMQVGQLAKQLADCPFSSFGANTEKNPNKECKVVMTKSRLVTANESENGIGAEKQQLVSDPALDPVVESLSESQEELEVEDEKKNETTIKVSEQEINEEKNKEKEIERKKIRKQEKKERREKKRETTPAKGKEVPYPLVPFRKDKERHLMASQKRKAPTSASQARYDRSRFTSQEAWDRYSDIVIGRKILAERNVMIYHTEFDEFKYKELAQGVDQFHGWEHRYPEDKSPKQVRVRGHLIKFDEDALNTFLKTPGFELSADGLPLKILQKNLTTLAQTWSVLSFSNLASTSHTSDITLDRARLIYGIIQKMDMNLGYIISAQISMIA
ncbi:hypothetical protein GmHk_11G032639 [Glycine max]|nr:hypothetical protein GmHk_11G032639 [Glycine max]